MFYLGEKMSIAKDARVSENDGWLQWSQYVLKELERLNKCYESVDKRLNKIDQDIVALKIRSGMWGLIAGMIPSIGALLYTILR